ncbi:MULTISPECIES: choline kinase family protein [unclassified Paraburkholderia]|uniref:choline kinase family protein n=1 Tax=unclassified Paraburkholderia TaxID=2615204 RepID=UPI00161E6C26|nr:MULTISPECIES: choline kinase family protein [unclassified Paraburkholderia]MBB5413783.1 thiamine kinase-like enzyme [Paraburkholderia sp. HC6.4b]MBB5456209.1 thiamine kinase-like enzyme [Paraburkholderia sp. Kb1A]
MKALGQAQTHHEHEIEAAIRELPAWKGYDIRYAPVGGGISNTNWRVEVDGAQTAYFFKVPGQGTEMFIDRRTAHEASVKAAITGYGAPVFAFLEDLGVEVFEFMEGWRASSNLDFLEREVRHNALRALKAFNDQPVLAQTKTMFDMIDEHQQQVEALHAVKPPDHDWLCQQYRRARAALEASGLDLAPCMNDTLAGNFMLNDAREIRLVDFEYASNNDRHYELALWFGEMFFAPRMELALLEDYFGRVTPQVVARVQLNKALADLKWSTWAMVQRAVSRLDFDFYKYGFWKQMRARIVFQDPQWETWLRQA